MSVNIPSGDLALSWSGGKDSSLTLWTLRQQGTEPRALVTTITEPYQRVSMHGVRRDLLHRQSRSVGVELVEVPIPAPCPNETYEQRMAAAFAKEPLSGVTAVASGDLYLQDVRAYREERLAQAGKSAVFPIWGRDTAALAREFIDSDFKARLVCVDPATLDASFAGRIFDHALLADLPDTVDPCGENGEFHTFVYDGPIFREPVRCRTGEVVERDGFVFCDLLPDDRG